MEHHSLGHYEENPNPDLDTEIKDHLNMFENLFPNIGLDYS
jgi:hypothetical protein